ncbi:hypothetical protein GQ53DRAFT_740579 [Thozetella sp. PMI_491]|nr:hypothetical protein GQ53DRAFT_740579 [Thozetella sp. PMI_491]
MPVNLAKSTVDNATCVSTAPAWCAAHPKGRCYHVATRSAYQDRSRLCGGTHQPEGNRSRPFMCPILHPRVAPVTVASPPRNRDEYIAFLEQSNPVFTSYRAEITDTIVDEPVRKVVLYMHPKATAKVGDKEIGYEADYVITLTMTEDGNLVKDQYDFIDSKAMLDFIGELGLTGSD